MKFTKAFRIFALLIAAVMLLSFAACSGTDTPSGDPSDDTPTTEKATYTVTFDTLGGSAVAAQTVEEGAHATAPADPTKEGMIFGGWAKDEAGTTAYDFDAETVTADITIYAVWSDASNASVATFYLDSEGAEVYATKTFANGSRGSTFKVDNPTKAGSYFDGWVDAEGNAFKTSQKYTGNQSFYAKWLTIYTLEAENTQLTGLDPEEDLTANSNGKKIGHNRSGECYGADMIQLSSGASGGKFVAGLYYTGAHLDFEITSDQAVEGVYIVLRLSAEFKDYELTQDDLAVEVNGKELSYNTVIKLTQDAPFSDFVVITNAKLKEGANTIKLVVNNDTKQFPDGTVNAAAPTVDCIYVYSSSVITMTTYDNK